ncbi:ferric reductase [Fusarium albosuccineum]|uniref:Ferric reductase n=1 Tax=Fusarium albosuccineum TaxID=1237068 RepID=A0A8H4P1V3_9HYPO|nr:ferric reductase [Fusarium albosuccineum]
MEKAEPFGHPLTYYYLNFPSVSRTQNHAFTAAIPASVHSGPVFLFQPTRGKSEKKLNKEWTWKLASSLESFKTRKDLEVRVEGPYPPRDTRFETASHIICIVGGTGITGAYSLVMGWLKIRAATGNSKFTLVWTMKQREMANLREWTELEAIAASTPNLTLYTHISSESGRLNPLTQILQALDLNDVGATVANDSSTAKEAAWIYSSGPDGLLRATETACIEARRQVREIVKGRSRASVKDVNWYIATWEA